jgi:hypothetical protein
MGEIYEHEKTRFALAAPLKGWRRQVGKFYR